MPVQPGDITRIARLVVISTHFAVTDSIHRFVRFGSASNIHEIYKSCSSSFCATFWQDFDAFYPAISGEVLDYFFFSDVFRKVSDPQMAGFTHHPVE